MRDMGKRCSYSVRYNLPTSDGHVIHANKATSDLGRSNFRYVERNAGDSASNAKSDDKAARDHLCKAVRSSLKDSTHCE